MQHRQALEEQPAPDYPEILDVADFAAGVRAIAEDH
jgi:hypothetical protein